MPSWIVPVTKQNAHPWQDDTNIYAEIESCLASTESLDQERRRTKRSFFTLTVFPLAAGSVVTGASKLGVPHSSHKLVRTCDVTRSFNRLLKQ